MKPENRAGAGTDGAERRAEHEPHEGRPLDGVRRDARPRPGCCFRRGARAPATSRGWGSGRVDWRCSSRSPSALPLDVPPLGAFGAVAHPAQDLQAQAQRERARDDPSGSLPHRIPETIRSAGCRSELSGRTDRPAARHTASRRTPERRSGAGRHRGPRTPVSTGCSRIGVVFSRSSGIRRIDVDPEEPDRAVDEIPLRRIALGRVSRGSAAWTRLSRIAASWVGAHPEESPAASAGPDRRSAFPSSAPSPAPTRAPLPPPLPIREPIRAPEAAPAARPANVPVARGPLAHPAHTATSATQPVARKLFI